MAVLEPFNPAYTQGITVAPGAVSASSVIGRGSKTLCMTNIGSVVVYVRAYDSTGPNGVTPGTVTVAATTADYPIPVGGQVTITKSQDADSVAYIGAVGGSLHIIPGEGW